MESIIKFLKENKEGWKEAPNDTYKYAGFHFWDRSPVHDDCIPSSINSPRPIDRYEIDTYEDLFAYRRFLKMETEAVDTKIKAFDKAVAGYSRPTGNYTPEPKTKKKE